MGILWVVVVTRPVKIGGHDAAVIDTVAFTVLAVVAFAELDPGDFGNGVGFVGAFQRAGEQGILAHGLRRQFGVDAAGAEKQQLFYAVAKGSIDDVGFNHQIVVNELGGVGVVGVYSAHLGSGQVDLIRFLGMEKSADGLLVREVEFGVSAGEEVGLTLLLQGANNGRTHHAPMSGNINFGGCGHGRVLSYRSSRSEISTTSDFSASISTFSASYSSFLRFRKRWVRAVFSVMPLGVRR